MKRSASASICLVTPPGYVHEYGDTRAMRIATMVEPKAPRIIKIPMPVRHFVKYTFLNVDPAWRRLDDDRRAEDKREFIAACEDFADGHLLRAFSLVGTRGDADLLLLSQAENL